MLVSTSLGAKEEILSAGRHDEGAGTREEGVADAVAHHRVESVRRGGRTPGGFPRSRSAPAQPPECRDEGGEEQENAPHYGEPAEVSNSARKSASACFSEGS